MYCAVLPTAEQRIESERCCPARGWFCLNFDSGLTWGIREGLLNPFRRDSREQIHSINFTINPHIVHDKIQTMMRHSIYCFFRWLHSDRHIILNTPSIVCHYHSSKPPRRKAIWLLAPLALEGSGHWPPYTQWGEADITQNWTLVLSLPVSKELLIEGTTVNWQNETK